METWALGNTGAQMVSKFNTNFGTISANQEHMFNVEQYGAVHDGVTDDTVAIQAAITACHTAGGGTVYLPGGHYIIGGALVSNTGAYPNKSQLYIPACTTSGKTDMISIKILGERIPPDFYGIYTLMTGTVDMRATVLESTLDVPDTETAFPAVFGSKGYTGQYNYNRVFYENLEIIVYHHATRGATLCGINTLNQAMAFGKNILISPNANVSDTVQPNSWCHGVVGGTLSNSIAQMWEDITVYGFYSGFSWGEGATIINLRSGCNYIGYMSLANYYHSVLINPALQACAYPLSAQVGTIGASAPAISSLVVIGATMEPTNLGKWWDHVDYISDTSNYLMGEMSCTIGGANMYGNVSKAHGGYNFLCKNIWTSSQNTNATATADGTTTGVLGIGSQDVTVTSANANYICCLPAIDVTYIGLKICGQVSANGFELRVAASQAGTVYLNNVTTNVEAAIPANSSFEVTCIDATHWILKAWTNLGAEITAIIPDAV